MSLNDPDFIVVIILESLFYFKYIVDEKVYINPKGGEHL